MTKVDIIHVTFQKTEIAKWAKTVKDANIKVD